MMITTILFDLDGTLLPMEQEVFIKAYFKKLAARVFPLGYEPEKLVSVIWKGMETMIKNDGSCTNEEAFWRCFTKCYGEKSIQDKAVFDDFYKNEFQEVAASCGYNPEVRTVIDNFKKMGYRTVLATNPVFPAIATESRIRWAGLCKEDFELVTTYENCVFSKPNPKYYEQILDKIGCEAQECLMVGNDVIDDMTAEHLGMKVFLLTDCLENKEGKDISVYPHGGFAQLQDFVKADK